MRIAIFVVVLMGVLACADSAGKVQMAEGKELAEIYCASCHLLPEPDLLDRTTWKDYILPRMGYMLGIYPNDTVRATLFETDAMGRAMVERAQIFPEKPLIKMEEWEKISAYYLALAPESLARPKPLTLDEALPLFETRFPNYFLSPPSTTLAHILPKGGFLIGDANTQTLYRFNAGRIMRSKAQVREGAVSVVSGDDAVLLTVMGSFSPTDASKGFLLALPDNPEIPPRVLIDSLQRPVHSAYADFDGDGLTDVVVCEFGKWTGSLSWWKNKTMGRFERHTLRAKPGAIRAYVADLNRDSLPDIVALFGQGDEGIYAYYNQGGGRFREEALLRFPASYGSSFFELVDYNGDGHADIVYTCGDNADYPPLYKPYHGIYVFENDGKNKFKQTQFFHLDGAYCALARDFDGDGDMDIAAISFFPDFQTNPKSAFVYLENVGANGHKAYTFPQVNSGRWIVMEAGDVDQDGDLDLLLGSLAFEIVPPNPLLQQWVKNGIPFVVLENQKKKSFVPVR